MISPTRPTTRLLPGTILIAAVAGMSQLLLAEEDGGLQRSIRARATVDYQRHIHPILAAACFRCHGPDQQEGGLRLDAGKRLLQGGDSGPVIQPGRSGESRLVQRVASPREDERMPADGQPLSATEIALLRAWIDQGAKGIPQREAASVSRPHWAFQPIGRPALPPVAKTDWVRNPIDQFVLATLEKHQIPPSRDASRETLIRRLYLDLLGLLPDWERVRQFIHDSRPDAYEQLVDQLLSSPHYGERWGRHWLDLARYADSSGYESDKPRQIWPYRDWVISSLNRDMPFDQFVVEQLAGDLLPNATIQQRIATGFHCNAILDPGVRWESIVDRVKATGAVFLGLTIGCAQCHSHKTDPITQREFYQLYAFFNGAVISPLELDSSGGGDDSQQPLTTLVMKHAPQPTHIFQRGDPARPTERVSASVPAFLHDLHSAGDSADRLDLARWIVACDNPLTARVTVNRIWQRFFGRGLVATEDDFGMQTAPPSHPDLLDYLASEFQSSGWSLKSLHRLIVCSATYRQTSRLRRDLAELDVDNRLLARQRRLRLEAEIIRDVSLAASGLLSGKIGGASVFPYQPPGVLDNRATPATWTMSQGEDRYRRGLYTWVWRLTPHPQLPLFDAPEGVTACTRRDRSNVPVQALTLLNDPTFVQCARSLAKRVVRAKDWPDAQRIGFLFQTCLSRHPQRAERQLVQTLLHRQRRLLSAQLDQAMQIVGSESSANHDVVEEAAWMVVSRTMLNLDEFITRE